MCNIFGELNVGGCRMLPARVAYFCCCFGGKSGFRFAVAACWMLCPAFETQTSLLPSFAGDYGACLRGTSCLSRKKDRASNDIERLLRLGYYLS